MPKGVSGLLELAGGGSWSRALRRQPGGEPAASRAEVMARPRSLLSTAPASSRRRRPAAAAARPLGGGPVTAAGNSRSPVTGSRSTYAPLPSNSRYREQLRAPPPAPVPQP